MIFCLQFGLMGILTPCCIGLSRRFGIRGTKLIANITRVLASYILLISPNTNVLILVVLLAIAGALANPLENMMITKYIKGNNSGKCTSFKNVCKAVGATFSSILIRIGVTAENVILLFAMIAFFYILDILFTRKLDFKSEIKPKKYIYIFRYIFKEKDEMKKVYAIRAFGIMERSFLPLYLYLSLNNFAQLAMVITISTIIQIVMILITGRMTDKNSKETLNMVCLGKELVSTFLLICRTKLMISFSKLLFDNVNSFYETTRQSITLQRIQQREHDKEILPSIYEMCLCFGEVIFFAIFAWLSFYLQERIFILMFVMSIISTMYINMKLNNIKKNTYSE